MSYEYRLIPEDSALANHVMRYLKTSNACVKSKNDEIHLKDWSLQTSAEYDARLTESHDQSIWLEINFRSVGLYNLILEAVNGGAIRCYENGDLGDEVSLKEAFRIKDST